MPKRFETTWAAIEAELATAESPMFVLADRRFAKYGPDIVAPLVQRLDGDDLRIVFTAGLALGQLPHADAIVPHLVERLVDPHPLVASHMRWVLRELGAAALPALLDCYASRPDRCVAIAGALAFLGPRARPAADILREDARDDPRIAEALGAIEGPWDAAPESAVDYIGEVVRLDADGPPELAWFGIELWRELVQHHAEIAAMDWDLWSRAAWSPADDRAVSISWEPDRVAIAQPELEIGAYNVDDGAVVTTTIVADNGATFTRQELLWKALDAHHRIAPCNDRIFEGLEREEDGSYYVNTGS